MTPPKTLKELDALNLQSADKAQALFRRLATSPTDGWALTSIEALMILHALSELEEKFRTPLPRCYSMCEKHQGQTFTMEVGVNSFAPPIRKVCPICEKEEG